MISTLGGMGLRYNQYSISWPWWCFDRRGEEKIKMSSSSIVANKVTLKGIVNRVFLDTRFFPKHNTNRILLPSRLYKRCAKGRHWTNECRSTRDSQGNPLPSGNALRGSLTGPHGKFSSIIPSHCRRISKRLDLNRRNFLIRRDRSSSRISV